MTSRNVIAELPIGQDGWNATDNPTQVKPTELVEALNIAYADGTIRKEGGATKFNASALGSAVLGGADWHPDSVTERSIVGLADGTLLKDTGAGTYSVTLKSGLNTTENFVGFFEGGLEQAGNAHKLFVCNGKDPMQVLSGDGATTTDISSPPSDWSGTNQPIFGMIHNGRHISGGNLNDPHRIYISTAADHERFTGVGSASISIYPGEGLRLVAAVHHRGLIIAFKQPAGIYLVDARDPDVTNWIVTRLSRTIGISGPGAAVHVLNDVAFIDQNGNIRFISTVNEFSPADSRSASDIASLDSFIRSEIDKASFERWRLAFYTRKQELHAAMTGLGAVVNNRRVLMDLNRPDKRPRFAVSDRDEPMSMWTRVSSGIVTLMMGDPDGFVWQLDDDTRSKDGAAYNGQIRTAEMDLAHLDPKLGTVEKQAMFLEMVAQPLGDWTVDVQVFFDGRLTDTVSFNLGTSGQALGVFTLDTSQLAGEQVISSKRHIHGSGRRVQFLIKNNQAGQDFSLARFYFHFTVTDERDPDAAGSV